MPKLFISYRRNDSADATGRLHDRLKNHFGEESLFYDVDSIPLGHDFHKVIGEAVGKCDALLAIIGETWVEATDENGQRRLENPNDLVRIEVESALARDIPVVPVLIGKALMPTEPELPGGLKTLARRNAATVHSGTDFEGQVERLIRGLERLFADKNELGVRVHKASKLADDDPEIALVPSRKVLEVAIREMYERRIGEPAGTRTLEKLTFRLAENECFPHGLDVPGIVQRLEGFLARVPTKNSTKVETSELLAEVMAIVRWYMTVEQPNSIGLASSHSSKHLLATVQTPASRISVVPKGLRSFDANDADFFLDLLPGPRDKDGLPESIRFWKHRIEGRNESTFMVGVIYGPSGCGKSSLVKAGLLPRLSTSIESVYVEATADDTEGRLLKGLRKRYSDLPSELGLAKTIETLRHGNKKLLLVIDQFEQWLHAKQGETNTELAQALRQCDGEHVQCIVLVRDDFWMGLTRFMQELQVALVQDQNAVSVDLFDLQHAKNVLMAFGRAFGRVSAPLSKEQDEFLDQAVEGLAQDGRVISVRLALFAEMVKGKSWTSATLKEVGGTEGVGVTFLEETFSSSVASSKNRLHQNAARAVLKALLPETGSDIKGNMQSHGKLLEASGYAKTSNYEELLRILDSELKLITGTEPVASVTEELVSNEKYYQLTHDYLVPSLRDWLTRKQKETRRGRAELLLADRAVVWTARQENRQLPSLRQWLSIRWLTAKKNWTPPQRKMMAKASRYHVLRSSVLGLLLAVAAFTGMKIKDQVDDRRNATHASGLVNRLLDADIALVPQIVSEVESYRHWCDPLLREKNAQAEYDSPKKLRISLALLPVDPDQNEYLYNCLLQASPSEVPVILEALAPYSDKFLDKLWAMVERADRGKESPRLRAAAALAKYDASSQKWDQSSGKVVEDLVSVNPDDRRVWSELYRPVRNRLFPRLKEIFKDHQLERTAERGLATSILADYTDDNPTELANLLMDADEKQFAVIFSKFKDRGEQGLPVLIAEIDKKLPSELPSSDDKREALAKRQANAAVALLRMNQPAHVWSLLKHSPDPRVRSYLIHKLYPLGADARTIVMQLDPEKDITIRRALVLSLGEFREKEFTLDDRKALLPKLQEMYRTDSDPGLHSSVEWLLRTWEQQAWLKQMNDEWAKDQDGRDKKFTGFKELVTKENEKTAPHWYVNTQGQTMVLIPGPVEFLMGSPQNEKDRSSDEVQHKCRIGRSFAIAAKPVTLEQYRELAGKYDLEERYTRFPDLPVIGISWYMAAKYCNFLSRKEGLDKNELCYEEDANGVVTKLKSDYLSLPGYRLPTEAEMEYATRAKAITSRYYGETDELLGNYAWYNKNSNDLIQRVGTKKPNDFGLFDVQGNCYTWCQESYKAYPQDEDVIEDKEDKLTIISTNSRVLRGGSFISQPSNARSSYRNNDAPSNRGYINGFRLARTVIP